MGIGKAGEPFEGIGKGVLNIEGLPVYRDASGGIGTPTSDNERTKMNLGTTHILAIVNGYNGKKGLKEAAEMIQSLLNEYAESDSSELIFLNNQGSILIENEKKYMKDILILLFVLFFPMIANAQDKPSFFLSGR